MFQSQVGFQFLLTQEESLTEIWSDDPDDDHSSTDTEANIPWQLKAILIFILAWQFSFGVSSAAFMSLLLFLQKLFKLLGTYYNDGILQELSLEFPKTRNTALQIIGIGTNTFEQYIVCPCCNAIYDHELGYTKDGNDEVPKKCHHIEFPYHPYVSMREPCGSLVMKSFKANTSFIRVKPFKVFAYQSLKKAMTNLLNTNITYGESACSFIPIQRIAHHCAYSHLDVVISPHRTSQKVFVAIPIQLKYSF